MKVLCANHLHAWRQLPGAEIDARCGRAGLPLTVHENFRGQSPVQAVRRAIDVGSIGTPSAAGSASARRSTSTARSLGLAEGRRFIIEDLGIHILDIARFVLGVATTISASTQRLNPCIFGDDVATMLLRHAGGAASVVDCCDPSPWAEELFPQTLIGIDGCGGPLRLDAGCRLTVHHVRGGTRTKVCKPQDLAAVVAQRPGLAARVRS